MSLERWETHIKAKPGREVSPTFFMSDAEEIPRTDGVTVRYLVVGEGDTRGFKPGVYIQTNVTPEGYNEDFNLRIAIGSHVTVDLMDRSAKAPSVRGDAPSIVDYGNFIKFQYKARASNGAIVLSLNHVEQAEVEQRVRDVESGSTRMKFVPKPPTS